MTPLISCKPKVISCPDVSSGLGSKFSSAALHATRMWQRASVLTTPTSRVNTHLDPHDYKQSRPNDTPANQRAPLIADDFLLCLRKLVAWLEDRGVSQVHFPILDPERPVYPLANLYRVMMDLFADTNIHVVLHNRVYVSILGIEVGVRPPCCHFPS